MASDLTVQTIRGPGSGANANKIIIPSGQTLDVSNGSLTLPNGSSNFRQTSGNWLNSNITFNFSGNGVYEAGDVLSTSITPKNANSKFLVFGNISFQNADHIPGVSFKIKINGSTATPTHGSLFLSNRYNGHRVQNYAGSKMMNSFGMGIYNAVNASAHTFTLSLWYYNEGSSLSTNVREDTYITVMEIAQ